MASVVALWEQPVQVECVSRPVRRVLRLIWRSISAAGQHLIVPEHELDGWTTTLAPQLGAQQIIELYADHWTAYEQGRCSRTARAVVRRYTLRMSVWRHRLAGGLWLALMAMLGLVLAPTVSHAVAWARGDSSLGAVCTSVGLRSVAPNPGRGDAPQPDGLNFDHLGHLGDCPMCALAASAWGGPSQPLTLALPLSMAAEVPLATLTPPRALFEWRQAQPRGPPRRG